MRRIIPAIAAAALTVAIGAGTLQTVETINRALAWHDCLAEQQRAGLYKESHAICRGKLLNNG
jgi:hypothetical protein